MQRSPIRRFVIRFALAYVLLILPWPGFHAAYSDYFRAFGGMVFAEQTERSEITFETARDSPRRDQTRVVIVNKALMNYDGSGPVRNLEFDAHSVGWRPIALLTALIFATPISSRRRIRALVFGTLGIHVFLLLFLVVGIWSEANELPLAIFAPVTPFWKEVATGARRLLISQIGLFLPVLVWGVVTFRRDDMIGLLAARYASIPPLKNTVVNG